MYLHSTFNWEKNFEDLSLTTDKCPFLALATSSSDPGVKSMIPSFPWPTVNVILQEEQRDGYTEAVNTGLT